jgi:hypothetical protein
MRTKLTPARIKQLEREMEIIDVEIDNIVRDYYQAPNAQNVGGNIGQLSMFHAMVNRLRK